MPSFTFRGAFDAAPYPELQNTPLGEAVSKQVDNLLDMIRFGIRAKSYKRSLTFEGVVYEIELFP